MKKLKPGVWYNGIHNEIYIILKFENDLLIYFDEETGAFVEPNYEDPYNQLIFLGTI